jgi:hypothetical protein
MSGLTNKVWHWESMFPRAIKHTMWLVLAMPLFCYGNPLPPKLVTYTFSGDLYSAWDMEPLGPYSGSIGIDANAPGRLGGDGPNGCRCWREYLTPPIISFVLGNQTWSRNAESGPCSFGVWNGLRSEIFDLVCGAVLDPNMGIGSMSAWWRFENYLPSNRYWFDIPLGPFAPDDFQAGWIFGQFVDPGGFEGRQFRGSLRLTGVYVTSEPDGFAILFIGLFGILLLHRREKELVHRLLHTV